MGGQAGEQSIDPIRSHQPKLAGSTSTDGMKSAILSLYFFSSSFLPSSSFLLPPPTKTSDGACMRRVWLEEANFPPRDVISLHI